MTFREWPSIVARTTPQGPAAWAPRLGPQNHTAPGSSTDPPWIRWGRNGPRAAQAGSINILTLGYVVIALLAATVLVDVSSVYLDHKKLLSLTDGAVSAAADAFDITGIAGMGPDRAAVRLDGGRVRVIAADYLRRSPAATALDGLVLVDASGSPDGRSATVRLAAVAHPPLLGFFVPDGIAIESTSTARARLVR